MFTWVPLYQELAKRLLEFRDKQGELIAMLKEISGEPHNLPMISLRDDDEAGNQPELSEIDPFTFFASFNRGMKDENRLAILRVLKELLNLQAEVPTDLGGIPTVNNMAAWFFPYLSNGRKPDDIAKLWDLADAVVNGGPEELDATLFARCLEIRTVAIPKLTMGMFWFDASKYLGLDQRMQTYLGSHGIKLQDNDLNSYRQFIAQTREKLGDNHPQISYDAWQHSQSKQKYWAGGHDWSTGSQLDRFLQNDEWQLGYKQNDPRAAGQEAWALFEQIEVGDEFAIKGYGGQADLKIYCIGKVVEKNVEDRILNLEKLERSLYRGKGPKGKGAGNWFNTLVPVTRTDIIKMLFHADTPAPEDNGGVGDEPDQTPALSFPLNQILYGPPGTGKTYRTIERAVEIIDSGVPGDHAACKQRFDELLQEGRIGFITFHQSYSYEDFIEGIRPLLNAGRDGEARYDCRDGVLKELSLRALGACLEPARPGEATFEAVWSALLDKIDNDPAWECPGLSAGSSFKINVTDAGNLQAENTVSNTGPVYSCPRRYAETVWNALRDGPKANSPRVKQLIGNGHINFIGAVVEELKRLRTTKAQLPEQGSISPDAVRSFLAGSQEYRVKEASAPRYVLVIDEINRGNISKILGELITLLEDDKRLPGENSLTVKLPYSGDRFALPANLYLLGTMNTADKSLALVDVALRRRFEFVELAPDWKVCPNLTSEMRDVLRELNARITLRKDREHRIGHAYFVHVADDESFNHVFRYRVIPLLQEYFYNDWEGLRYVLGDGKSKESLVVALPNSKSADARNKWQWLFDAQDYDGAPLDCLKMLRGNYGSGVTTGNESKGWEDDAGE